MVSTALLIAPQFPQRLDGARPEASGVARPILALSTSFQASTPAKLRLSTCPSPFLRVLAEVHKYRCTSKSWRCPRHAWLRPVSLQHTGSKIAAVMASAGHTRNIVIFSRQIPVVDLSSSHKPLPTPQKSLTGVNSATCGALWSMGVQLQQRRCGVSRTPRLLHAVLRLHALLLRVSSVLLGSP